VVTSGAGLELKDEDSRLDRLSESNFVGNEHPRVGALEELQDRLELVRQTLRPRCDERVQVVGQWSPKLGKREEAPKAVRVAKLPLRQQARRVGDRSDFFDGQEAALRIRALLVRAEPDDVLRAPVLSLDTPDDAFELGARLERDRLPDRESRHLEVLPRARGEAQPARFAVVGEQRGLPRILDGEDVVSELERLHFLDVRSGRDVPDAEELPASASQRAAGAGSVDVPAPLDEVAHPETPDQR
jgi:hypothetical protein